MLAKRGEEGPFPHPAAVPVPAATGETERKGGPLQGQPRRLCLCQGHPPGAATATAAAPSAPPYGLRRQPRRPGTGKEAGLEGLAGGGLRPTRKARRRACDPEGHGYRCCCCCNSRCRCRFQLGCGHGWPQPHGGAPPPPAEKTHAATAVAAHPAAAPLRRRDPPRLRHHVPRVGAGGGGGETQETGAPLPPPLPPPERPPPVAAQACGQ